eukprot:5697657-Prymnesium_polylepis.1
MPKPADMPRDVSRRIVSSSYSMPGRSSFGATCRRCPSGVTSTGSPSITPCFHIDVVTMLPRREARQRVRGAAWHLTPDGASSAAHPRDGC